MRNRRGERGAAAVEFALVAPLFLAFVFGIIEGSRLMEAQQAVTAAARSGAREAALSGATTSTTTAVALAALTAANISTTGVSPIITPSDPSTAAPGADVKVTVTVPYSSVTWLGFYFQGAHITATMTLRKED